MSDDITVGRLGAFPSFRHLVIGSLFWLAILLALEPGNLLHWHGGPPSLARETLRLSLASLLGGLAGLAVFWLAINRPIYSWRSFQNISLHAAVIAGLTILLLVLGNFIAALVFQGPGFSNLPLEITADFLLLVAGLSALDCIGHFSRQPAQTLSHGYLRHLTIKDRTTTFQLPLDTVERMEAQENYVALHTKVESYLYRSTITSLAAKLDPSQFIRVHRCMVVNRESILGIKPLGNGKIQILLNSGSNVIASRTYAATLRAQLLSQPR